MNRKEYYGQKNKTDTQYKISIIHIEENTNKEEQVNRIRSKDYLNSLSEVNFMKKVSQKKAKDFLCKNILNVGLFRKTNNSVTMDNVIGTDFIFIDFEENSNNTKEILSFEKCLCILKENKLNYILKTSQNHTFIAPRLHLFLPTLSRIKNDQEYKHNLSLVINRYFNDYSLDTNTKNINRWVFTSNLKSLDFAFNFSDNDIEIEKVRTDIEKATVANRNSRETVKIDNDCFRLFNKQISNMYGFEYNRTDNYNIVKYYRDKNDKIGSFWHTTLPSDSYDIHTIYDKKDKYNLLFSYKDFLESKNIVNDQKTIQERLKKSLDNWFVDGGKEYIVTNEGLGKSTSILDYGKKYNFVYVCHSISRINEVSERLTQNNIKHKKILGNSSILKMLNYDLLSDKYLDLFENEDNDEIKFKEFINKNASNKFTIDNILDFHKKNIDYLKNNDCIRLVTSKKLSMEIRKENYQGKNSTNWYKDHRIIFDEFNFNEWATIRNPKKREQSISIKTIWNTKANKDEFVNLVQNDLSFMSLLKHSNNVLILTTERYLIKPLFYKTSYKEMFYTGKNSFREDIIQHIKFEKKLFDDSVIYILTKSTRKGDHRDNIINKLKNWFISRYKEDITVISDGSSLKDISHLGVKGSNEYLNKNTLVIGTFRTEIEDNIFYTSCYDFFEDFKKHTESNNLNVDKEVQNFIKAYHLQAQVSQSIGRNSGFRNKYNKKTLVVLPLLSGNSQHSFKHINFNYVSPNVHVITEFDLSQEES